MEEKATEKPYKLVSSSSAYEYRTGKFLFTIMFTEVFSSLTPQVSTRLSYEGKGDLGYFSISDLKNLSLITKELAEALEERMEQFKNPFPLTNTKDDKIAFTGTRLLDIK